MFRNLCEETKGEPRKELEREEVCMKTSPRNSAIESEILSKETSVRNVEGRAQGLKTKDMLFVNVLWWRESKLERDDKAQ